MCILPRLGRGPEQPLIKRLSLQNLTTMKKSDSVINTDVHELYHMTQRNVHPRSEYDSAAFNRRPCSSRPRTSASWAWRRGTTSARSGSGSA